MYSDVWGFMSCSFTNNLCAVCAGGKFDVPDRAFHSIALSWRLSSEVCYQLILKLVIVLVSILSCYRIVSPIIAVVKVSTSDVKELIPEFFYLPDFLLNKNKCVINESDHV